MPNHQYERVSKCPNRTTGLTLAGGWGCNISDLGFCNYTPNAAIKKCKLRRDQLKEESSFVPKPMEAKE